MSGVTRGAGLSPWVIFYGVLGLVPFWAPLTFSLIDPATAVGAATIQAIYAGVILSFLGGARFGRAFDQPGRWAVVSLSMIPSIMSLFILALPTGDAASKLIFLAAALAMALAWDLRAADYGRGYKVLRIILTLLAIAPMAALASISWPRP
jgi:hypothetical protein